MDNFTLRRYPARPANPFIAPFFCIPVVPCTDADGVIGASAGGSIIALSLTIEYGAKDEGDPYFYDDDLGLALAPVRAVEEGQDLGVGALLGGGEFAAPG